MSLEYEPPSEPLNISAKQLSLNQSGTWLPDNSLTRINYLTQGEIVWLTLQYRGTSPKKHGPHPYDLPATLSIGLR